MTVNDNPMTNPEYTSGVSEVEKISLKGSVFIFGSGKLVHEKYFFDPKDAEKIITYDPFEEFNIEAISQEWREKIQNGVYSDFESALEVESI